MPSSYLNALHARRAELQRDIDAVADAIERSARARVEIKQIDKLIAVSSDNGLNGRLQNTDGFVCEGCGREFSTQQGLTRHWNYAHA